MSEKPNCKCGVPSPSCPAQGCGKPCRVQAYINEPPAPGETRRRITIPIPLTTLASKHKRMVDADVARVASEVMKQIEEITGRDFADAMRIVAHMSGAYSMKIRAQAEKEQKKNGGPPKDEPNVSQYMRRREPDKQPVLTPRELAVCASTGCDPTTFYELKHKRASRFFVPGTKGRI